MLTNLRALKEDFLVEKWSLIAGCIALIICDALQLFVPRIIRTVVDDLTLGTMTQGTLLLYAGLILLISGSVCFLRYLWRYWLLGTAFRVEENIRKKLFKHFQKLSVNYYASAKTGDLMAHATNDINQVRAACGQGILMIVDTLFVGIACFILMFLMNVRLTLYVLIPLVATIFVIRGFDKSLRSRFERVQEAFSDLTERARENFAGIRVIKGYAQEEAQENGFATASMDYLKKEMRLALLWSGFFPLISIGASIASAIVIIIGGRGVILNDFSIGSFVAFVSYLAMFTWPMMAIGWVINILQRGEVSMGRINKILNTKPEIEDTADAVEKEISGDIEFRNLTYQYPDSDKPILQNISFHIPVGGTLAIVGRIGSGKTTIANLIPRLLEPKEGEILIDETDVKKITLGSLRSQIGFVPQDTFLFSDSIRENITFARPNITNKLVEKTAKIVQIHNQISTFTDKYSSLVGERGVMLSGGEKQRTTIARAILAEPKILILDDCFSSVDTDTEEKILKEFKNIMNEKTCVIISHRISTVRDADEIIVLDEGTIAERGTHEQLIKYNGIYADIYQKQQLEESLK
ncbi:MAG: ABC transporter ATP-binding protein [Planctomycetota bacterium]